MIGEHDFKPEVRKQAADLVAKEAVFLPIAGDLRIEGLIRGTPPAKVALVSSSVGSPSFEVYCSCPKYANGQFCKHICAVILAVETKHPDFLDSKREFLRRRDDDLNSQANPEAKESQLKRPPEKPIFKSSKISDGQAQALERAKAKQAEYRREQSARLKLQRKSKRDDERQAAKGSSKLRSASAAVSISEEATEALRFFAVNGFKFEYPVPLDELRNAKKILSRIFHPDKGGTHEEMLEMNRHFDALIA